MKFNERKYLSAFKIPGRYGAPTIGRYNSHTSKHTFYWEFQSSQMNLTEIGLLWGNIQEAGCKEHRVRISTLPSLWWKMLWKMAAVSTHHLFQPILRTGTRWPTQRTLDREWVWDGHLIGRNDSEARPRQSDLSPRNLTGTWQLSHGFPCESAVQWPQTLNVDDNRSCMAIATEQDRDEQREARMRTPHAEGEKEPVNRGRGKGQTETLYHPPGCWQSSLLASSPALVFFNNYPVFFFPLFFG